jgi:hypothetical protein
MTALSPMVTPGFTIAPPPSQTLLPIKIGMAFSGSWLYFSGHSLYS